MSDRPLGHQPWFSPTRDRTPNAEHDDEDQKALRAFGRQLEQIMFDADIGGVLLLNSKKSSSWVISLPRWSNLSNEGLGLRLRTAASTPEGRANADASVGFVGDIRDLAFEVHGYFAKFFNRIQRKIEEQGGSIEHQRIGTPGKLGPHSAAKAKEAEAHENALRYSPERCTTAGKLREMGVELDPTIPDAAWVEDDTIIRVGDPADPEIKIQIWAPFRWVDPSLHDRDSEPPILNVRRPATPDESTSTD